MGWRNSQRRPDAFSVGGPGPAGEVLRSFGAQPLAWPVAGHGRIARTQLVKIVHEQITPSASGMAGNGEAPAPSRVRRFVRPGCYRKVLAFAVAAVLHAVLLKGHLGPVTDQEARGAGEFIGLLRNNNDRQLFAGQIRTGKIDAFSGVVLIDVDHSGLRAAAAGRLKGLQRLSGRFFLCLAWGVVIGSHIGVHFRCCAAPFQAPQ